MRTCLIPMILASWSMSVSAFDHTELENKLLELKDRDPKVRAAAFAEWAPIYAELIYEYMKAAGDRDPGVIASRAEWQKQFQAKMLQLQQQHPELARSRLNLNESMAVAACKA